MFIGKNAKKSVHLLPQMLNRHGLITGSTGSGKTMSLKVIVEQLSNIGVPSLLVDVKGDLSGFIEPGELTPGLAKRIKISR